nr:MAG TPA: hypothetical protein [Caudoviricetes sp.]
MEPIPVTIYCIIFSVCYTIYRNIITVSVLAF